MTRTDRSADHGFEFFPTQREVVYALLESSLIPLQGGVWLEPCAGTGRILTAVREQRDDISWVVGEIDDRFDSYLELAVNPRKDIQRPYGSFLEPDWAEGITEPIDVAIFNPPFSLTIEFITAAMEIADTVICLQRQGWFGTQGRAEWLRSHCPDTYDLPWRPSFRPDGKTDNCEYSWFVWPDKQFNRRSGIRAMLDAPETGQQELFGQ